MKTLCILGSLVYALIVVAIGRFCKLSNPPAGKPKPAPHSHLYNK